MILLIGFLTNSSTNAYAINNGTELFEEKIYCNTTIDEDFDESCVLVVIDKYHICKFAKRYLYIIIKLLYK